MLQFYKTSQIQYLSLILYDSFNLHNLIDWNNFGFSWIFRYDSQRLSNSHFIAYEVTALARTHQKRET